MTTKCTSFCLFSSLAFISLLTQALAADTPYLAPLSEPSWGQVILGEPSRAANLDTNGADVAGALGRIAGQHMQSSAKAPATISAVRENAVQQLRLRAGAPVDVVFRPGHPSVIQIRGAVLEPAASGFAPAAVENKDARTAMNFLHANRALLRLEDPANELQLISRQRDELGQRHMRYDQSFLGVEVWPSSVSVHLDALGNVTLFDGAYVPTPAGVSINPSILLAEATQRAQESVPGGKQGVVKESSLIIYAPLQQVPRLAWRINLAVNLTHVWRIVVDAQDGRVLSRGNLILDANVKATATDLLGKSQTFNVWSANNTFDMADTTKGMFNPAFDPVKDPHGVISIFDARDVTENALKTIYLVDSTSATTWLPDAVSAMVNFSDTYDYYLDKHKRNSLDGNGGNVQAVVRIAQLDNAFWSGDAKMMFFGDVRKYAAALDVVGHELTHGVTQNSANLIYELQSGAMNEAFSDIFGEMVEARTKGQPDWLLGEDLDMVFRDMKNPESIKFGDTPLPGKMSEYIDLPNDANNDSGGVHENSSIINHAYYMLAEGLADAAGIPDAEKIFYRCLTVHLQKQSQFIDARLGCIASADELFGAGSAQSVKVGKAFDAVEIFDKPSTPDPSPIPVVQGPDSALFVGWDPTYGFGAWALGRYETAKNDPVGGVAMVESVLVSRPAVSGDGSFALFVDGAWDLCGVNTDDTAGTSRQCIGYQGYVHSVAVSPDARLYAFVLRDPTTGVAQNKIYVYDYVKNTTAKFDLVAPVLDSKPAGNVLYADSMVFTSDSKQLIYDALTELKFGSGSTVQRWTIFRLDLATSTTVNLVPPQEGADFGNPSIGRAGNRYLTFDARATASQLDSIVVLDLFTGDAGIVGDAQNQLGYPCFTGDESAIIYAAPDSSASAPTSGSSLYRQPLSANRLATSGARTVWVPDSPVGVVYRRGTFTSSNSLPVVALQSPANGATFSPGGSITLQATASDADGTVAKVEFYEGSDKIGESTAAPYSCTWTGVAAGNYLLIARAIDNVGGTTDSAAVSVTVGASAPIKLSASLNPDRTLDITVAGQAGSYTLQQSSDLKNWTDNSAVTIGASGSSTVTATGIPASQHGLFYRVRKN